MSYDNLVFSVLRVDDWSRHNVFTDGGNYLYTHHEIAGAAILNPDLMSPKSFSDSKLKGRQQKDARMKRPFGNADSTLKGKNDPFPFSQPITNSVSSFSSSPGAEANLAAQQNYATASDNAVSSTNGAAATADTPFADAFANGIVNGAAQVVNEAIAKQTKAKNNLLGALAGGAAVVANEQKFKPKENPANLPGGAGGGPADAAISDFIVRQRLAVPRRKLFLWMHSNLGKDVPRLILESPLGSAGTDCKTGPHFDVTWMDVIGGNTTIVLGFKVTTDVNNWVTYGKQQSALLGNSWSFAVSHDQDYFATHIIEGVATFRRDVLEEIFSGRSAHDFRSEFMHPIPVGFKREKADVKLLPDGTSVAYTIVDVEQPMTFVGALGATDKNGQMVRPYATRVAIMEEQEYSQQFNV